MNPAEIRCSRRLAEHYPARTGRIPDVVGESRCSRRLLDHCPARPRQTPLEPRMGMEHSQSRKKRRVRQLRAQERRWEARNGPVTVSVVHRDGEPLVGGLPADPEDVPDLLPGVPTLPEHLD